MKNYFTEEDEKLAQSMKKDPEFRKKAYSFISKIDPAIDPHDEEAMDTYCYGLALKFISTQKRK